MRRIKIAVFWYAGAVSILSSFSVKKGFGAIAVIVGAIVVLSAIYVLIAPRIQTLKPVGSPWPISTPTPTPFVFTTYTAPKIEKKSNYAVFMIGDSMTLALGPHGGKFSEFINELYKKDNSFVSIDNYAQGSSNILSVGDQLTKKTTYWDSTFEPLLSRKFDLILVESFGYNPLSSLGLEEGIKRQNVALSELMTKLISTHPTSAVVFVATIAPNKENYAKKVLLNLSTEDRKKQAIERIAYIENHINYAKAHNIPVVNIYEKSQNSQHDGVLKYINPDDYIHPSFEGVDFIGHELANFIYESQILPKE